MTFDSLPHPQNILPDGIGGEQRLAPHPSPAKTPKGALQYLCCSLDSLAGAEVNGESKWEICCFTRIDIWDLQHGLGHAEKVYVYAPSVKEPTPGQDPWPASQIVYGAMAHFEKFGSSPAPVYKWLQLDYDYVQRCWVIHPSSPVHNAPYAQSPATMLANAMDPAHISSADSAAPIRDVPMSEGVL
jgi:hypothetical protein